MREPSLQGRIYGVPNKVFPQLRKPPRTGARWRVMPNARGLGIREIAFPVADLKCA